jgi:uncharacterized membrane protein
LFVICPKKKRFIPFDVLLSQLVGTIYNLSYFCRKNKMEKVILVSIIIHVSAGIGALVSGALAILLRKNTPKHKPVGRFYFWCMTVIFITGIFLSLAKQLVFFFFIAIFTYYATLIAYRALRLKNLHTTQKPLLVDWLIQAVAGGIFLCMVIIACFNLKNASNEEAIIALFFSSLGLLGVYGNVKRFIKGPKETNYWLKTHIGNMLGSYIGAITAFLVNQSEHIPVNPIILWLGPTIILVPISFIEIKKVKSEPLTKS